MRGLVPRWGRGGAWQNPPRKFAVPNLNSRFSYLGVPAPAGMNVWYENSVTRLRWCLGISLISHIVIRTKACPRTPIRDVPSNQPRCRLPTGEPRRIVDPWSMARKEECSAGACPPLGPGSGVAESAGPTRLTRPQLRFSDLRVPAAAGICDSYESMSPDSDPGCALQSTSMPAPHRRNVPNCRPMVDGQKRRM